MPAAAIQAAASTEMIVVLELDSTQSATPVVMFSVRMYHQNAQNAQNARTASKPV